jgi:hypothetical protein
MSTPLAPKWVRLTYITEQAVKTLTLDLNTFGAGREVEVINDHGYGATLILKGRGRQRVMQFDYYPWEPNDSSYAAWVAERQEMGAFWWDEEASRLVSHFQGVEP